jgi:lycopene cyclase domain-containing protein
MTLTYLQFHLVFLVPVLVVLGIAVHRYGRSTLLTPRARWAGTGILVVVALVYTTPWDNYLITRGVWWYGEGRVAATIWHAPVEEYLFMALQPIVAALWLALLPIPIGETPTDVTRRERVLGVAGGLAVTAVGMALLAYEPTFYLGAILAWAGPVLAIQWGFGWPVLWALRRPVALGVFVPSVYLWAADRVAIELGIWVISERYTTGFTLAGLPIEEALFFLVTNLFVVQGLVLLGWLVGKWRSSATSSERSPVTDPRVVLSRAVRAVTDRGASTRGPVDRLRGEGSPDGDRDTDVVGYGDLTDVRIVRDGTELDRGDPDG